ncbi:hypothetical protein KC356_g5 [Hortaea werneckii]|nr:hypothetical protein KC356_g5 [Hortaea werneckii]
MNGKIFRILALMSRRVDLQVVSLTSQDGIDIVCVQHWPGSPVPHSEVWPDQRWRDRMDALGIATLFSRKSLSMEMRHKLMRAKTYTNDKQSVRRPN